MNGRSTRTIKRRGAWTQSTSSTRLEIASFFEDTEKIVFDRVFAGAEFGWRPP
jgi:hypothetical protein